MRCGRTAGDADQEPGGPDAGRGGFSSVSAARTLSCAAALGLSLLAGAAAAQARSGAIGLVLGNWRLGIYETPDAKEECPQGFQYKQIEQFKAQFPTPEARQAWEDKHGYPANRGPNGENVFYFPTSMTDPLPFKPMASKKAIGLNLDDETEGKGRGVSAPHENFVSLDGEPGIDNQLYRVVGCIPGWRKGGMIQAIVEQYIRSEDQPRLIMEITGVQDERNSPHVTVTLYRGLDGTAQDPAGNLIPFLSQRIDYEKGGRYITRLKGRIEDGVLTTEPADIILPGYENPDLLIDRLIHQARLKLKLTPTGAQGLLGGYVDIESWYSIFARSWGGHTTADVQGWSGPATWRALQQFADYRDPASGKLTGISTAYQVGFARAYVLHDPKQDNAKPGPLASR